MDGKESSLASERRDGKEFGRQRIFAAAKSRNKMHREGLVITARTTYPSVAVPEQIGSPVNVLSYVHMRNIHGSTGAGRVARQLTEHMAQRSDVNLHVLADAADHARILPLVEGPWRNYPYHTFTADTSRQQARWFALNSPRAESFWNDVQIVHCTAESFVPVSRARLVVTVHDAAFFEDTAHRADLAFCKQRMKWKLLFAKLSRNADMFHTVSHFSADRLGHFFPSIASRLRVVHNAVTPHFFNAVPEEGLQYLGKQKLFGRPFVLVPGGLHFRKNAELILAACPLLVERHPDLKIVIVNHSNAAYLERARAFEPNIKVLGFVSDEALHALYSTAAVVWFPSRYEGFGLPVIEAMACGATVVANRASSLPEIAGDAALLVADNTVSRHVAAIEDMLGDSLARQQFAAAGRERAAQFTWGSSAEQLKHHFDSLL
jgi:glycosyltransferase involved in cell wall biosynthesis